MRTGERSVRIVGVMFVVLAAVGLFGWSVTRGAAQAEEAAPDQAGLYQAGLYQAVAPDCVLNTATGKLTTANGQVLEAGIDPGGTKLGKYSAAGYATAVTRAIGLDLINQPFARTDSVKAYLIVDTETGKVVKQRVYYRQPLDSNEF